MADPGSLGNPETWALRSSLDAAVHEAEQHAAEVARLLAENERLKEAFGRVVAMAEGGGDLPRATLEAIGTEARAALAAIEEGK